MKSPNWLYVFLLLTAGTLWGVAFLVADIVLETIPPFTYIVGRNFLVSVVLIIALYARGEKLPRLGRQWWPYLFVGFFDNALPVLLSSNAQYYVDSGLVTIFVSTTPFFTLLLARQFIKDEPIQFNQVVGIGLGLVGIVILIGPAVLQEIGVNFWSQLALLAASLCYAIATVFSRGYLREGENGRSNHTALEWLTGQFVTATIIMLPLSLIFDNPLTLRPSQLSLIALFISAWGIAIFAFLAFYRLNALAGPTYASFVTYLIPINGVIWGAIILQERVTINALVALAFILCGLAVVNGLVRLRVSGRKKRNA
ncbi:MAG: DMT family transporter [Chloroflexota bacterium]